MHDSGTDLDKCPNPVLAFPGSIKVISCMLLNSCPLLNNIVSGFAQAQSR